MHVPLDLFVRKQYQYLFNSCRIPCKPADYVKLFDMEHNNHVIVLQRNMIFSFELIHNNKRLSQTEILKQLEKIYNCKDKQDCPVGILTVQDRDTWTDHYEAFAAIPQNQKLFEIIHSSVLVLALDESSPLTSEEIAHECWHGQGLNRWFDKTVQLIVFQNGRGNE